MELIADILLIAGAFGAGLYCIVLSRRLTRFTDLEQGVGGAVAILSVQVDDLKKALEEARTASTEASERLEETTSRAESAARSLELLMATSHRESGPTGSGHAEGQRSIRRRRRATQAESAREDAA